MVPVALDGGRDVPTRVLVREKQVRLPNLLDAGTEVRLGIPAPRCHGDPGPEVIWVAAPVRQQHGVLASVVDNGLRKAKVLRALVSEEQVGRSTLKRLEARVSTSVTSSVTRGSPPTTASWTAHSNPSPRMPLSRSRRASFANCRIVTSARSEWMSVRSSWPSWPRSARMIDRVTA